MDYLKIKDKNFLITGVANKKSIAFSVAKQIEELGARCLFSVYNETQKQFVHKHFPEREVFICDVEQSESIEQLALEIQNKDILLDGFLHSIAFADFSNNPVFHEVNYDQFSQAVRISCFSLVEMSKALRPSLTQDASVVTLSISTNRATPYGYMGPIKAMLNSSVDYLAHSFAQDTQVRFNVIGAGPLKTSASSGIPNYIDNYLYAEKLTLRKQALKTAEVADSILFLLSPRSSGLNASFLRVDAGMEVNYFDREVVKNTLSV